MMVSSRCDFTRDPQIDEKQISHQKLQRPEESWLICAKCSEEKNCQPGILFLAKLSFRCEGEIEMFPEKQESKESVTRAAAPQSYAEKRRSQER